MRKPAWLPLTTDSVPDALHICPTPKCERLTCGEMLCAECRYLKHLARDLKLQRIGTRIAGMIFLIVFLFFAYAALHLLGEWLHVVRLLIERMAR